MRRSWSFLFMDLIGALALSTFMLFLLVLLAGSAHAQPASPSAEPQDRPAPPLPRVSVVTDKLDDLYRAQSSHGTITMSVIDERGTRKLTLEQWTKGEEQALYVVRAPAREAGTATLKTDEGLWNYAPRADRLIRIPSGMLSDNWMGSHFTNDDLVRETSWEQDYTTKLSWITRNGQRRLEAVMVPKPQAPVVWTKVIYEMQPETWLPLEARFYDDGKLVRTMRFSKVKKVDEKRHLPTTITLIPEDEPGERTVMEYDKVQFNVDVDSSKFSKRGLRRVVKRR